MWGQIASAAGGMMGGGGGGEKKGPDFAKQAEKFMSNEDTAKKLARQQPEDDKGNTKIGGVF